MSTLDGRTYELRGLTRCSFEDVPFHLMLTIPTMGGSVWPNGCLRDRRRTKHSNARAGSRAASPTNRGLTANPKES